jgi:hypothetical protein
MWRDEFRLLIRGLGADDYIAYLRKLAAALGVESRVTFEKPEIFDDIVPRANGADIGYMLLDHYSPQHAATLPNKFF